MNNDQAEVAEYFKQAGIYYIAGLSIIFESVQAGILLSQLLYWNDKGWNKRGWVYKNTEQLFRETGLKRSGQETAIRKLVEAGVLEVKLAGIPATRHFRINKNALLCLLDSLSENDKLKRLFVADKSDPYNQFNT